MIQLNFLTGMMRRAIERFSTDAVKPPELVFSLSRARQLVYSFMDAPDRTRIVPHATAHVITTRFI